MDQVMRVERMRQAVLQDVPLDLVFAKPPLPPMAQQLDSSPIINFICIINFLICISMSSDGPSDACRAYAPSRATGRALRSRLCQTYLAPDGPRAPHNYKPNLHNFLICIFISTDGPSDARRAYASSRATGRSFRSRLRQTTLAPDGPTTTGRTWRPGRFHGGRFEHATCRRAAASPR